MASGPIRYKVYGAAVLPLFCLFAQPGAVRADDGNGLTSLVLQGDAPGPMAGDGAPGATPFKLTLGSYQFSGGSRGTDLNLRYSGDLGNLWLGQYFNADQGLRQWRTGWDSSYGEAVRLSPSVQWASGGFVGGSLQVETGSDWFVGAGFGRTNLRPYWNLNFDPNDSWTLSAGHRDGQGQVFGLLWVRDNRENPDQRHLHGFWRQPLADGERITVDLLYKQGLVEGNLIRRWGWSLSYDWPRFFVRLAWDPNSNFTTDDLWRFSLGTRF